MRSRCVWIGALAIALIATRAHAQDGPAGAVQGSALVSTHGNAGVALTSDLWVPIGPLRLGGFFGIAAMPSGDDIQNRIFMPLALSAALEVGGESIGVSLRGRGGMWGGATQDAKLTAGGFLGVAAYLLITLGGGANFSLGLDVWGLLGPGETVVFAPSIGFTWTPTAPES